MKFDKLATAIARNPRLPRFACHLYQRLKSNRLNLVTGAGISVDAKVPAWKELLRRLAEIDDKLPEHLRIHEGAGLQPEYLGQIIYHRYNRAYAHSDDVTPDIRSAQIEYSWGDAIHRAIYRDVATDISDVIVNHPYLQQLRDLSRRVSLVINFNFDDLLSHAIGEQIKEGGSSLLGNSLSVTWQPPLTDRPGNTTVYHVNGILPRVDLKKRSPQLIFTEDSFADARARSPGVNAEYLFLRFVQNTMLLIGHSLADTSLKSYLRQNRDKSPANHHYMVHWIDDDNDYPSHRRDDIFDANLNLYNLITIFLRSEEIREFFCLLLLDDRQFREAVETFEPDRRSVYHYYIVGPVAAGKSTLLEHLRCFDTLEEWTRPPPKEMYLASDKIGEAEQRVIDRFLNEELKEKNIRMHAAGVGFHFMDRAPLDLYAFTPTQEEEKRKSRELRELVTRSKPLQQGEVLFVHAEPSTIVKRNMSRGRHPDKAGKESYFLKQTSKLKEVYSPSFVVSTDELNASETARKVARYALLEEYAPTDLQSIISRYE
ncbi:SIR2 family protein [Phreatobacter cathodiphilus]|uniref:Uncharacterized protein n=1 Tax=Phreatobacter cathodiphilus TaxID=1868589 RepID=A0A2S0NFB8_9HYPH|nr:SIR2 family protein [Phreatobacter cathodiphilus]AVO46631.1 hypothetical protein C6569_17055 [Phreatobacter cathodiphilus]